jgi:pimeloyl-ACP methyl ester carboxylesterase
MTADPGRGPQYRHDGLVFDVRDEGPADGEPVVLLHGFPQDSGSWHRVAPLLHAAGLRTLAPDQRGYSPGARPRGRRSYRMPLLVADVLALLDDRGLQRAHVVGHDWGGAVGWGLAGGHPHRVSTLTVLSTPHPSAMIAAMTSSTQPLASWYMAAFQLPVLPEAVVGRSMARSLHRSGLPREDAERYERRMSEPGALTGALAWYRALPFSAGPLSAGGSIPSSRVPTTYAWGRRDFALKRRAAELTARYVEGPYRFEVLEAGHWLPERRPSEVADLVLDRVRG